MATTADRQHESTTDAVGDARRTARDSLARRGRDVPARPVAALALGAYVVLTTAFVLGASAAALYVGSAVPGAAGTAAFFTVGLGLVAAAPTAARVVLARAIEIVATDVGSTETDAADVGPTDADSSHAGSTAWRT